MGARQRLVRRDILSRLRDSGPLTSRAIPDTSTVPWASTGWTHNRNVTQMLEYLMRALGIAAMPGEWRVDPAALGAGSEGRTALLSPFDRLIHDRARTQQPRRPPGGDARRGRRPQGGVLRVNAIHEDMRFTKAISEAVRAEIDALAAWLGLQVGEPRSPPE